MNQVENMLQKIAIFFVRSTFMLILISLFIPGFSLGHFFNFGLFNDYKDGVFIFTTIAMLIIIE